MPIRPDPLIGWPATPQVEEAYWERIKPKRRLDCLPGGVNGVRPCPWASCKEHLIHFLPPAVVNDPRFLIEYMQQTCTLDIADGLTTLEGEKTDGVPAQALAKMILMRPKEIEALKDDALAKLAPKIPDMVREESLEEASREIWDWNSKTHEEPGQD